MTDDELKHLLEASATETRRVIEERLTTIDARFTTLENRIDETRLTLGNRIDETRLSLEKRIDETRLSLEKRMDETAADMRHQFDLAREATKDQVEILAESVLQTKEDVRRVEEKIESTAAETQAMIKFSHRELDRRLSALEESHRTLEETVADLNARVHRLEGGTH